MDNQKNNSQLLLPFNLDNRKNRFFQPQFYQNLDDLIEIEENIESLQRKGWDDKIDFYQNLDVPDDFIILDHKNNNVIIFLNQFRSPSDKLTIGTQIIRHWLLGETIKNESKNLKNISLTKKELEIFFKGSQGDVKNYQKEYGFKNRNQSLDWKLYHYSANYFNRDNIIGEHIDEFFGDVIKKYSKYELRISYGIVSNTYHRRSNKRELRDFIENFLNERGFKIDEPYEFNDHSRNGEPILLWINENFIGKEKFKSVVGMNFGYDNGLSSFRLALGLYFDDENLLFPQINNVSFNQHYKGNELFKNAMSHAFRRWVHHKNWGEIEKSTNEFFKKHYSVIYDNMAVIINNANNGSYTIEQSERILTHTHKDQFSSDKDELIKLHNKYVKRNQPNRFTHFKIWCDFAESISYDRHKKSLAEFIGACVLGRK